MTPTSGEKNKSFPVRLWLYQSERFPLLRHGLLIASFSSSAVCVSALLRGTAQFPQTGALIVSFLVLLTLFLQLRIADEFKDAKEDACFRPERPVPRGLISLKELAITGVIVALFQAALVLSYDPPLMLMLTAVWVYMALMTAEFFVPAWLKSRLFLYMASHMLIMPLIDLLATACDWLVQGVSIPAGLAWFLVISFLNGMIIELGRKTWAPSMERPGVESYSSAWGLPLALSLWGLALVASMVCALTIAYKIDFLALAGPLFVALLLMSCVTGLSLWRHKTVKAAARLEHISGLWVFCIYLFLGLVPMMVKSWM